jgi:hypothetical protein
MASACSSRSVMCATCGRPSAPRQPLPSLNAFWGGEKQPSQRLLGGGETAIAHLAHLVRHRALGLMPHTPADHRQQRVSGQRVLCLHRFSQRNVGGVS